jgi:outer membrane protein
MNNTADIGLSIYKGTLLYNLNYLCKQKNKSQQKRMKQIILTALLIVVVASKSISQQATPDTQTYHFTLADCIKYAYEHQHDVINANLDVKSANYHVKEIIGQGLPQINGAASFQDYLKTPSIIFPDFISGPLYGILNKQHVVDSVTGRVISAKPPQSNAKPQSVSLYQTYNSNLGVTASQILFDPNYIIGLQGRRTYKELYERSYVRTQIEANVNVTKAYYQVLVSDEQIKLLDANLTQLKQQLDQTVAQNKQGFVEKIDVDRLTVQYNNLVNNRENTVRLLVLNYQLLKFQMGMPIQKDLILKDKLSDINIEENLADIGGDTSFYQHRIEYNLLETQKKLNEYDLKSKKGQFLPKISANANSSILYQNNSFSKLFGISYPSTYIGLSVTLPIFTGFQHLNQVKQSQITVLKNENDLYNLKNTLNLQVSQARINYINGLKSLQIQRQNQQLAQEVLRVARIKYQQGVGSSIEVTQAQTDIQQADNSYIQGLYNALVSKVDLDKAYGRIK